MWRNERLGLIMIFASLLVMSVVLLLSFNYHLEARLSQTRSQGISLVRLLSGISREDLVPVNSRQGVLQALRHGQSGNFTIHLDKDHGYLPAGGCGIDHYIRVADDEAHALPVLEKSLKRPGYEVEGVLNGQAALEGVSECCPDPLITHIKMRPGSLERRCVDSCNKRCNDVIS